MFFLVSVNLLPREDMCAQSLSTSEKGSSAEAVMDSPHTDDGQGSARPPVATAVWPEPPGVSRETRNPGLWLVFSDGRC